MDPLNPPWWFKACVDDLRYRRMMDEGVIKEMLRQKGFKRPVSDEEFENVLWPKHREYAVTTARREMQTAIDALGIHDIHRGMFKKLTAGHDLSAFYSGIPMPRPAPPAKVVYLLPASSLEPESSPEPESWRETCLEADWSFA